jgi:hypothetical protein
MKSSVALSGAVSTKLLKGGSFSATPARELTLLEILALGFPHLGLSREVFAWRLRNLPNLLRGLWRVLIARLFNLPHFYGAVSLVKVCTDGRTVDYGLASLRLVTTAGVNFLVDAFQGTTEPELFKYHGFGTGTNAESAANTALQTELTTQYATDNTRPTGSQTEGATANIYRSVATLSPDSGGTIAITEHGIFSADAAGTLLDRSVFSAVNVVAGADSLQVTFDLTLASGG